MVNKHLCVVNCGWPGGAALVAVCDLFNQPEIRRTITALGLFCHRPYYYARIKPRGLKACENVS